MFDNYYDYEEERDYVREIYWESKGMGRTPATLEEKPVVMANCPKCNRQGKVEAVAIHFLNYCRFDKD